MSEDMSNLEKKEMEDLLHDKLLTMKKHNDNNGAPLDTNIVGDTHLSVEKEEYKIFMEKESSDLPDCVDNYKIKIWREQQFSVNKALLAFRVTHFLWFGAGLLPSFFLGIFLKHRGLTLVELSSVYSMIFPFQLIASSLTGIITDKIGNAKPVLIFCILSTSSVLVAMSLTPNINNVSCTQMKQNLSYSNMTENRENFSSCYVNCLLVDEKHLQTTENYTFENSSVIQKFNLMKDNVKNDSDFASTLLINNSFDLSRDISCLLCANNGTGDCIKGRQQYLVIVYAILVLAFFSAWSTTYRFMNFTAVSLAAKNDSHFGKEQAFANLGELLIIVAAAILLNTDKSSGSDMNFDPIFQLAAGIMFCAFLTLYMSRVPILPPGRNLMKKAFSLVKDIDILAFISLVFMAGNGFAFNYTFYLVFLETLNAPSILVALHPIVIILYGFPVLLTFKWWLKRFGANKLFVLCLLFYGFQNAAYSYILDPWWSLAIGIAAVFTEHLFWTAVVVHCQSVAPVGFAATLNALTGTTHFGIGRSSGVFFGGMMMNYLGPRKAYRIMAAIFFITALLYSIFMYARHKYPKVNATANGSGTTDAKISKNADIQDV